MLRQQLKTDTSSRVDRLFKSDDLLDAGQAGTVLIDSVDVCPLVETVRLYEKLPRVWSVRDSHDSESARLLDASGSWQRGVGHDAALDQELAAAAAAGLAATARTAAAGRRSSARGDRSLTSDSTSTKPTKLSASSAKTGEKVSVSYRLEGRCRRSRRC